MFPVARIKTNPRYLPACFPRGIPEEVLANPKLLDELRIEIRRIGRIDPAERTTATRKNLIIAMDVFQCFARVDMESQVSVGGSSLAVHEISAVPLQLHRYFRVTFHLFVEYISTF